MTTRAPTTLWQTSNFHVADHGDHLRVHRLHSSERSSSEFTSWDGQLAGWLRTRVAAFADGRARGLRTAPTAGALDMEIRAQLREPRLHLLPTQAANVVCAALSRQEVDRALADTRKGPVTTAKAVGILHHVSFPGGDCPLLPRTYAAILSRQMGVLSAEVQEESQRERALEGGLMIVTTLAVVTDQELNADSLVRADRRILPLAGGLHSALDSETGRRAAVAVIKALERHVLPSWQQGPVTVDVGPWSNAMLSRSDSIELICSLASRVDRTIAQAVRQTLPDRLVGVLAEVEKAIGIDHYGPLLAGGAGGDAEDADTADRGNAPMP